MRYRKTVFETSLTAQWAAFFDLAGWTWTYRPRRVRGSQPEFRVEFPCGHSECGPTHSLYVMVRPFSKLSEFCGTKAMQFEKEHFYGDRLAVDAVALFGNHPNATGWAMSHGAGGSFLSEDESGLSAGDSVDYWVPDADKLWEQAGERIKLISSCANGFRCHGSDHGVEVRGGGAFMCLTTTTAMQARRFSPGIAALRACCWTSGTRQDKTARALETKSEN